MDCTITDEIITSSSLCSVREGPISKAIRAALVCNGIMDDEIVSIAAYDGTFTIYLQGGEYCTGSLPEELRDFTLNGIATPYTFHIDLSM